MCSNFLIFLVSSDYSIIFQHELIFLCLLYFFFYFSFHTISSFLLSFLWAMLVFKTDTLLLRFTTCHLLILKVAGPSTYSVLSNFPWQQVLPYLSGAFVFPLSSHWRCALSCFCSLSAWKNLSLVFCSFKILANVLYQYLRYLFLWGE